MNKTNGPAWRIRAATREDVATILELIRALADFEKLLHDVKASEAQLTATLFPKDGAKPAEVLILEMKNANTWSNAGFALFFTSYSTFLAQPGIYLEDLFIRPELRSHGYGRKLLAHLAQIAVSRNCGRLEWSVLDWNKRARDFYEALGAKPMEEWTVHRLSGDALAQLAQDALSQ